MSNKLYADNLDGFLVEGSKSKGYIKCGNKGFGDGKTSTTNSDYSSKQGVGFKTDGWFEGKKGSNGVSPNIQ